MHIRKETQYAIKALCYLYEHKGNPAVTAKMISDSQEIPLNFLYPILRKLKNSKKINIVIGCNGGYKIENENISLLDIIQIIEGDILITSCSKDVNFCKTLNSCLLFNEFKRVEAILKNELGEKNIFELIKVEEKNV